MSKSYKLKDGNYIDSESIIFKSNGHKTLKDVLEAVKILDLNDATTGLYYYDPAVLNRPSNSSYGLMISISCDSTTDHFWQRQIAFNASSEDVYIRHRRNFGSWSSWTSK